jgi:hypothetical protein
MPASWSAWKLDPLTWAWIVWVLAFVVLETVALWKFRGDELTAHLRPLFLSTPITWYLAFGLWLWLGVHFLAPRIERELLLLLRG